METKTLPVIEIFGPTIQGEGVMVGHQTYFLRLGGCDYRCSWCDTPYAVLPRLVKENTKRMETQEVLDALEALWELRRGAKTLTISGGNPAIFELGELIDALHQQNWLVVVETQGTKMPAWLKKCNLVTVSPKPPSSKMAYSKEIFNSFLCETEGIQTCIKIVVFDRTDFDWAIDMMKYAYQYRDEWYTTYYLQPGTPQENKEYHQMLAGDIIESTFQVLKWITEVDVPYVRVVPQVHALVYGSQRGV